MSNTSTNLPPPNASLINKDGTPTQLWYRFQLSILNRTGGVGSPASIVTVSSGLSNTAANLSSVSSGLSSSNSSISTISSSLSTVSVQVAGISTGLSNTNSSVSAVSSGLSDTNSSVSSVSTNLSSVSSGLSSINSSISVVSSGLSSTNSTVSAVSNSLSSVSSGLSGTNSAVSSISSSLSNNTSTISAISTSLSAISSGLASFAQGRWLFSDFDSSTEGGVNFGSIASGTASYVYSNVAGTYGVGRLTSSTSANSGGYFGWISTQAMVQVGCIFRDVFNNSGADTTLVARLGWMDSASTTAPANGAWLSISNLTIAAKTALSGTTSSSSTATLTANTFYVLDIEVLTSSSIRFVVWVLSTGSKVFDQTLTTNLPINANSYALHLATGNSGSAKQLLDCDFLGRGLARPSSVLTPI